MMEIDKEGKQKMAENCCSFFDKDSMIRHSKKPAQPALRMIVLAVMICCVYISLFCLQQIDMHTSPKQARTELMEKRRRDHRVRRVEISHVHYPKPTTHIRKIECPRKTVRFFAILSTQRSGSGWLVTLLNSHGNINCSGEIFYEDESHSNMSAITGMLDKVYSPEFFSNASKNKCTAAVGFKWMLNQGLMEHQKEIVEYFKRRRVYCILLFRRNLLRQLVSLLANTHDQEAKQLNGTHKAHVQSRNEADVLAKYKPTINTKLLVPNLRRTDKSTADALESFKSTHHILLYYEDLVKNQTMLMDVQKFLGVPERRLVSRHVKIHTRPLSEQVKNWNAVYNALKGTRHKKFLNADYDM